MPDRSVDWTGAFVVYFAHLAVMFAVVFVLLLFFAFAIGLRWEAIPTGIVLAGLSYAGWWLEEAAKRYPTH